MLDKSAFSEAIDYVLQDEGRVTAALVPGVFQSGPGDHPLAPQYRTRHQIEAVQRIWATAELHSLALVAMLREDYDAARLWAEYTATELGLDKLNLEEAAKYGVDEARVRASPPLRATVAMIEITMRGICALGSMPSVAHAVVVEWNWARAALLPAERARETQGLEFIKAIAAHPERQKHSTQIVEVAHRLANRRPDGVPLFLTCLRHTSAFFRAYFAELQALGGVELQARQPDQPRQPKG
jgi:hypothetical protein